MNRKEREDRRRAMAEEVKAGKMPKRVASKFRVTVITVYSACREFGISVPTSNERRSLMALEVLNGATAEAVAKEFGVTAKTVRKACEEFRAKQRINASEVLALVRNSFQIAGKLCRGESAERIATDGEVPVATVVRVQEMCVEAGILPKAEA